MALTLGLRQGEALGLRWQDVDLEMGYIRVNKQLQRIEGRFQLVEPKTPRSRRALALPIVDRCQPATAPTPPGRRARQRAQPIGTSDLVFTRTEVGRSTGRL